jgi:hypothetical protein
VILVKQAFDPWLVSSARGQQGFPAIPSATNDMPRGVDKQWFLQAKWQQLDHAICGSSVIEELVVWKKCYDEGVVWRSQNVAQKSWGSVKFVKLSGQNDQSFDLPPLLEGCRQAILFMFISGFIPLGWW